MTWFAQISESGTLKVGDFGLARMRQGDQMSQVGHWSSMAPEMLRSEKDYTEKVDVYGFGISTDRLRGDRSSKTPWGEWAWGRE